MATLARVVSAALFLLPPVAAFAGPAEEANEAVDRWVAAYNSNDLNAITNMYTPDAILLGRISPILTQGPQAIHDFFLKSMGSGKTNAVGSGGPLLSMTMLSLSLASMISHVWRIG